MMTLHWQKWLFILPIILLMGWMNFANAIQIETALYAKESLRYTHVADLSQSHQHHQVNALKQINDCIDVPQDHQGHHQSDCQKCVGWHCFGVTMFIYKNSLSVTKSISDYSPKIFNSKYSLLLISGDIEELLRPPKNT